MTLSALVRKGVTGRLREAKRLKPWGETAKVFVRSVENNGLV